MRVMKDIFATFVYNELGIVPMVLGSIHNDVGRVLDTLSPEVARKMKRKFRKLWRAEARSASSMKSKKTTLGLGSPSPSKQQKNSRKAAVAVMVEARIVPRIVAACGETVSR